jgi:hypothetical protein
MHKKNFSILFMSLVFAMALGTASMQAADHGKILGSWQLEIDAAGEYYYLTMILLESETALQGKVSEDGGYFYDVPLKDILFESNVLTLKFTSPTPPDGLERIITCKFEVGDDLLEGSLTIEEMGLTAYVTGKREKK